MLATAHSPDLGEGKIGCRKYYKFVGVGRWDVESIRNSSGWGRWDVESIRNSSMGEDGTLKVLEIRRGMEDGTLQAPSPTEYQ